MANATNEAQLDGTQKTQIVNSSGIATDPATQTTLAAISTAQTDGTQKVKTSLPSGTHVGVDAAPNGAAVQFSSVVTTIGWADFSALIANTAPIYIGRGAGVTASTGLEILPGASRRLPCANLNEYYVFAAVTQHVHGLAL